MLHAGQIVKAQVLGIDTEKRQIKLSIRQLVPTSLGEYLAEHNQGDTVSGRVVETSAQSVLVELGEGIRAVCAITSAAPGAAAPVPGSGPDLSALTSMLNARWKGGPSPAATRPEPLAAGQVRSFRIARLDREREQIEVEPA